MEAIGKIIATEKQPSTIEEFTFWTRKDLKLKPFDVVVVDHVMDAQGNPTKTYGVIEEKVQTELQSRENEIVAMREKSFMGTSIN